MESRRSQAFRYFDTDADRKAFADDLRRVRQSVIQLAENLPQDQRYEPRYHGWSLAALLAHLHGIDNLALFGMKLALLGIRPPLPLSALNAYNDFSARIFQRRLVETTIRGIKANQERLIEFVMLLPIDRFTREVYYPPDALYLTLERAVQQYFLFHWQEHLETMHHVEGIYYEPPGTSTEV